MPVFQHIFQHKFILEYFYFCIFLAHFRFSQLLDVLEGFSKNFQYLTNVYLSPSNL